MKKIKPIPLTPTEEKELVNSLRELYIGGIRTVLPDRREDCSKIPRPCPYVSCKYNTYLDISKDGVILISNKGNKEPWGVAPESSCVLDIVEDYPNGMSNQSIADILNVSRETVRLTVMDCLSRIRQEILFIEDDLPGIYESESTIKRISKNIVSLKRIDLDHILIDNPLVSIDDLLHYIDSKKIDPDHIEIVRYTGILEDDEIASIVGKNLRFILGTKIKLGYDDNARPGEYTKEYIVKILSVSDSLFNSWVEQGLAHRQYKKDIIISRSDILRFFMEHSKAFYLLKYGGFAKKLLRLDVVENYLRRFE